MTFIGFLSTIAVAVISTFGLIQVKKLERKNTQQHLAGVEDRNVTEEKLLGKLESIHGDVQTVAHRVGGIDWKLDAHIADRRAHDKRVAISDAAADEAMIEHGDAEWATAPKVA